MPKWRGLILSTCSRAIAVACNRVCLLPVKTIDIAGAIAAGGRGESGFTRQRVVERPGDLAHPPWARPRQQP